MIGVITILLVGLISSAFTAIGVTMLANGPGRRGARGLSAVAEEDVVFLFRDGTLVDATPAARAQLPREPAEADELARLVIGYGQRFGDLATHLDRFQSGDRFEIAEVPEDPQSLRLLAEKRDGLLRITLVDPLRDDRSEAVAHYSLAALRSELLTLRSIAERSPIPTWKQRADGTIVWANSAYIGLARRLAGEDALIGWPPPDVFASGVAAAIEQPGQPRRTRIARAQDNEGEDQALWFDLMALPGEIETLFFAQPIDRLVRAETALTDFVQTLTKTFAHLRVGLGIFDRKRRLVLFNPALMDLTGLPADQLTARPTLHAFLDALRDRQRIPEPKDYRSWRMQIAQLEADASAGVYEDTWHLPGGQTLRVTGRPHPDGAVAYMFEDISSEVSKTRSFRSDLELGQSIMDNLDTAVAAFSPAGALSVFNRAYAALWDLPENVEAANAGTGILEATQTWSAQCRPTPVWDTVRRLVLQPGERFAWSAHVETHTDERLRCDVRPLVGGATLVSFTRLRNGGADLAVPQLTVNRALA